MAIEFVEIFGSSNQHHNVQDVPQASSNICGRLRGERRCETLLCSHVVVDFAGLGDLFWQSLATKSPSSIFMLLMKHVVAFDARDSTSQSIYVALLQNVG